MPNLTVAVAHTLGQQEALSRLKNESEVAKEMFGQHIRDLEEQWTDNAVEFRFHAFGFSVSGSVTAQEDEVKTEAELPMAAIMFRGLIEQRVKERLGEILA